MRFLIAAAMATFISAPLMSAPIGVDQETNAISGDECPEVTRYFAHKGGKWQGKPVRPQKLAELPPADTYAAVFRHDERGCVVLVKYHEIHR